MAQRTIGGYDVTEFLVVGCLILGVCLGAGLAVAMSGPLVGIVVGTLIGLVLAGGVIAADEFA